MATLSLTCQRNRCIMSATCTSCWHSPQGPGSWPGRRCSMSCPMRTGVLSRQRLEETLLFGTLTLPAPYAAYEHSCAHIK